MIGCDFINWLSLFDETDVTFDNTVLIYILYYLRSYGKNPITRHPCNISEQEFVNLFVRKKLPVILTDCQAQCGQSHYQVAFIFFV